MRRSQVLLQVTLLAAAVVFCAASSRKVVHITERQDRIRVSKGFANYSPQDQRLIKNGQFRIGMDEYGLYLARGKPSFYWHTLSGRKWCRVLLFGKEGGEKVDMAVYTCGARVAHWARINPPIPCWRLDDVAPRLTAALKYFERRPLSTQWQIVTGLLKRKQSARDLALMLGKPYNTGVQAREDGTNAATQVFLDSSGEAYGLHVTLIRNLVAGWKIPAARQLTPEAQARRLKATEKRLIAKMQEIEARSIKRHREEMSLLSSIQSNQTSMMEPLVDRATSVLSKFVPSITLPGGRRVNFSHKSKTVRGGKKLTINGCTYTDGPGGELGRPCGGSRGGCSSGYSCNVLGSGSSGVCVPDGQCN